MNEPPRNSEDVRVEQIMGNLLRAGVLLAAAVVLLGGVVYLIRHGADRVNESPNYRVFHGEGSELTTLPGIFESVAGGRGRGIIQLGLLLLIATPVARVVFSVVAFGYERDWTYVVLTLFVLGVLFYSLFFAQR
jgi:uncharacterized membrane protein